MQYRFEFTMPSSDFFDFLSILNKENIEYELKNNL